MILSFVGYALLCIALFLTVTANVLFRLSEGEDGESWFKRARQIVVGAMVCVVVASAYMATLIALHRFEFDYIAEYSAKRSASWYLFAAFWGGQEGSIMLWTFWTAILGAVLAFRGGDRTRRVWPIFGLVQVFLLGLLIVKCPFHLGAGAIPADGKGLNPLLENMWMVIHPPILFLGFASLVVPFSWCVYGLIYRDWDGWARLAFPWAVFSFAALGFGLSLGGFWAYETLGWGGFWGWDPVENSSLVPWLFMTALLHGIPLQMKNGGYKVTNFVLGFLPFVAMSYGTFLTRTGLLSDFSQHAFSAMGHDGFVIMLIEVLVALIIPTVLLLVRLREIPKPMAYEEIWTRQFGYFLASTLLGILGLIVAVGMSSPLLTKIPFIAHAVHADPTKGAAAQPEYYNQGAYPLILLMTVAMSLAPYLAWRASDNNNRELMRKLFPPYLAAILLTVVFTAAAMAMHLQQPAMIFLFAVAIFAVLANAALIAPRLRRRESRRTIGGFVAHVGASLLLAGVASLVLFTQKVERIGLTKDLPEDVLGFRMTYLGMSGQPFDESRQNVLRIRVEKFGRVWEARPHYYLAPWASEDTLFANPPAILPSVYEAADRRDPSVLLPWNNPFPLGDLYVAWSGGPGGDDRTPDSNNGFVLQPNQPQTMNGYTFNLEGLELDDRARALSAAGDKAGFDALPELRVTAVMDVTYKGHRDVVSPIMRLEPKVSGRYSIPVQIAGPDDGPPVILQFVPPPPMALASANPFSKGVPFRTFNAPDPTDTVFVDVSTKPLIGLVWCGTLLYSLGGFIAYRRRAIDLRVEAAAAEKAKTTAVNGGKKRR